MSRYLSILLIFTVVLAFGCIEGPEEKISQNLTKVYLTPQEAIKCIKETSYGESMYSEDTFYITKNVIYSNSTIGELAEVKMFLEDGKIYAYARKRNNTCWTLTEENVSSTARNDYYIGEISIERGPFKSYVKCEKITSPKWLSEKPKEICES